MKKALQMMLVVVLVLGTVAFGALFFYTNGVKADVEKDLEKSQTEAKEAKSKYKEIKAKYDRVLAGESIEDVEEESDTNLGGNANMGDIGTSTTAKFNEETVRNALHITEYSYANESDWGNYYYYFLAIKNTSDFTIEIDANVKFYKSGDQLIGAKSDSCYAVGKDQTVLLYFSPDEAYIRTEYDISVEENTYSVSRVDDLAFEHVAALDKEIITLTNNGTTSVSSINVDALFFKNGQVVYSNSAYSYDELKSGKSVSKEISCYEEYDDVEFFITCSSYN